MLTSQQRAYEVARRWMPDSPPDSVKLAALAAHIELALDEQAAESVELVRQLAQRIDPTANGSRALFAVAKEFLAARGVK